MSKTDVDKLGSPGSTAFAFELLNRLKACSAPGPGVTRLPFTNEHQEALHWLKAAVSRAGLSVTLDAAGTLRGRREADGKSSTALGQKTLFIGSHQDSIVNGGAYDGIMGVVVGLCALERLMNSEIPFAIELLAFADEEGVRFPTALMGPRALAGKFNINNLSKEDGQGIALGDAMTNFGLTPSDIPRLALAPEEALGYLEIHIEQGPVLEAMDLPVASVTGICGIERWQVVLTGRSDHAGTTPIEHRKDALCAASEMILATEAHCASGEDLVGVVGQLTVQPNVVNAVPGRIEFSLELRSPDDRIRETAAASIIQQFQLIAERRGVHLDTEQMYSQRGVLCDERLQQIVMKSIERESVPVHTMMSGATHDASAMADLCSVAMVFVRCKGGISHHPDESVTESDLGKAIDVMVGVIEQLQHDAALSLPS